MLANIHSLLLNDLLLALLRAVGSVSTLRRVAITRVTALLVEGLLGAGALRAAILLNDEVRGATQVSVTCLHLLLLAADRDGVLADVVQDLTALDILHSPPSHIIVRFLFLKALEDDLVLPCDLHEFTLACLPVQTLFVSNLGKRDGLLLLGRHGRALAHLAHEVSVGVRDTLRVLQDVGHLLEQDAVLTFDLSVPLF